jgi:virulence plasmid B protein
VDVKIVAFSETLSALKDGHPARAALLEPPPSVPNEGFDTNRRPKKLLTWRRHDSYKSDTLFPRAGIRPPLEVAMASFRPESVHLRRILTTVVVLAIGQDSQAIEKASERVSPFYGSLSRSIPIEVPPFHGLEPKLSFSYSSEGRNGLLGVGWSIAGLSTIERVNAGLGTPRWDEFDTYVLDGQELTACGTPPVGPSCTSGGSHGTKDESYLKIFFDSTANTWTVWGRDGTRTIFSPILQTDLEPEVHTLRWGQTSTIDTKGNTVTTTWTCLPGEECYPEAISCCANQLMRRRA